MALNFNTSPYYDDFDPSLNYHKILFKPGFAVQARELTQSQSILQNQISNFADNIFTQNTPIKGGKVTTNLNAFYIKLNTQYAGVNITAAAFLNKIVQDASGTILAKVIATAEATGTGGDPPTLIVTYLTGRTFGDAMTITPTDGTNITATAVGTAGGTTSVGPASVASISNGIFYIVNGYSNSNTQNADGTYTTYTNGYFVTVNPQTIILDKYDNAPSFRVGLSITETVVDYINDASLLDPAVGASNYQAPGADRYQINLTLITLPLTLGNDDQFIELVRIVNGSVVKQVDGTVYSVIDDYFAKRDYETNGDYVVNDFKITPSANSTVTSNYDLTVSKGIAYVRGYRIENQSDLIVTNQRARTTSTVSSNPVYMTYGNYFFVDTVVGDFDGSSLPQIDLHCTQAANVVTTNNVTYNSTLVGTAFLRDMIYVTDYGSSLTNSYIYKAYVTDVSTSVLSGNASSGTSNTITFFDTTGKFSSVANVYYGVLISITGGTTAGDTRTIVSYNGATKTATVDNNFTVTPDTTSNVSLVFATYDVESLANTMTSGSNHALANSANINVVGKVNGIPMGDTILEATGAPEMLFSIGQPYVAGLANTSYTTTRTFRNQTFSSTTLTLTATGGGSMKFFGTGILSASQVKQNFLVIDKSNGKPLDFVTSGNTVVVSAVSGGTTAILTGPQYSGKTVDVVATMSVSNGDPITDGGIILKYKNLTLGNTTTCTALSGTLISSANTYVDSTYTQVFILNQNVSASARMSLFVNDVKRIRKIVDTKSTSVLTNNAVTALMNNSAYDVTNLFSLDNGQRDGFYDHAAITLLPGAPRPQGNILVVFDYYKHTGGDGYFSVVSYLNSPSPESYASTPSYTSKNGDYYPLSDTLDFRPCRQNGQTAYIWEYSIGNLMPVDSTQFTSSYSYYLGRDDKLVLTKDGNFQIVQGAPSSTPTFPAEPDGSLVLATLTHDPYTAYVPGEAPAGITPNLSINKIQHKRWAKSDITDLQTRVNNLEYYTSLSLLEQNAQNLQIPDVNGLNRFKNGILVDDFSSFATADTTNPDFASNLNIRTKQLTAQQVVNNFQLQSPIVLNSLGTLANTNSFAINSINGTQTNIFCLPYTTANAVVQPLASSTISVNPFSVTIQQGIAQLNPPMDNWVDNQQTPALLVNDPGLQVYQQPYGLSLTNSGDFATLVGTSAVSTAQGLNSASATNITTTQSVSAAVTQTYSSQVQSSTSAATSQGSTSFAVNNGYLTNIAVLPYIRPQQVVVKAKGLLTNSPISAWFDGQNVNANITTPNTIELTGVTGTFNEDDIVGFYASSIFYPVARVISLYQYPGTTNYRLYVAKTIGAPATVPTTTLQNAFFDSNGNYTSSTASGTVSGNAIISLSTSGVVSGVGGTFTTVSANTGNLFKAPVNSAYCSFLNQYGVWGDMVSGSSYVAAFSFPTTIAGTYTVTGSVDNSAFVYINGTLNQTINSDGYHATTVSTVTLGVGTQNVYWIAANSGGAAAFGLTIADPYGAIVFSTLNPPSLTYTSVGNEVQVPFGGSWFTGVTQLTLDNNASNTAGIYVGAAITVTSKYVYQVSVASTYTPPPSITVPIVPSVLSTTVSQTPVLNYGTSGIDLGAYLIVPSSNPVTGGDANYSGDSGGNALLTETPDPLTTPVWYGAGSGNGA